jgi:hypothetical protein
VSIDIAPPLTSSGIKVLSCSRSLVISELAITCMSQSEVVKYCGKAVNIF